MKGISGLLKTESSSLIRTHRFIYKYMVYSHCISVDCLPVLFSLVRLPVSLVCLNSHIFFFNWLNVSGSYMCKPARSSSLLFMYYNMQCIYAYMSKQNIDTLKSLPIHIFYLSIHTNENKAYTWDDWVMEREWYVHTNEMDTQVEYTWMSELSVCAIDASTTAAAYK